MARPLFPFIPTGTYFKEHAERAAGRIAARALGYSDVAVPVDVYADLRKIGIHVFRRRLENSKISGLDRAAPVRRAVRSRQLFRGRIQEEIYGSP